MPRSNNIKSRLNTHIGRKRYFDDFMRVGTELGHSFDITFMIFEWDYCIRGIRPILFRCSICNLVVPCNKKIQKGNRSIDRIVEEIMTE